MENLENDTEVMIRWLLKTVENFTAVPNYYKS